MSEMPNFYDNYPGETVEYESDPKWSLGVTPSPQTGETLVNADEYTQPSQQEGES